MTAIVSTMFFGAFTRAPTLDQLETLRAYSKGLGYVNIDSFFAFPASIFPIELTPGADANATTVTGLPRLIPFSVKCWGIDIGCVSAGGSAATLDVQRKPVGGSFATVFTAAKDIKTLVNVQTRYMPESGSELWEYNDQVEAIVVGTGSGAVVGARATCWVQMR